MTYFFIETVVLFESESWKIIKDLCQNYYMTVFILTASGET